jgi:adenosylmethionine---8-amino-7-oxononanoate aminotransferase
MSNPDWYEKGLAQLWLPNTRADTASAPFTVKATKGSRIILADGRELVDGMASWGTAVHGANHPHIQRAIAEQAARLPHAMPGGLLYEQAARLAARLAAILPGDLTRVFFSASGSAAVEAAAKMAVRHWLNHGVRTRSKFLAFTGAGHAGILPEHFTIDLPRDQKTIAAFDAFLEIRAEELAGIIVEPMVQGAGGMIFHDENTLRRLRAAADKFGLLLIFDEIFTGFGRTGAMFACEAGEVAPDIMTIGKGLTGGTLPLAAAAVSQKVFDASGDPTLMYGPTTEDNVLAFAAANAGLDLFERENRLLQANEIAKLMAPALGRCLGLPGVVDVRVRGGVGVVELERIDNREELTRKFLDAGVWIRPFCNVVTLTPVLTIGEQDLEKLTSTIVSVLGGKKTSS